MNDVSLACFLSVARTLSFSVSARILSIPQQSVSRNIQRLEEELGYSLLNREGQSVSLTRAGTEFYTWAQRLDQHLAEVHLALQRVPASLGVGWGDWTGCPAPLEAALRAFQQQHPAVELHFVQGSHRELLQFLRSGLIDLALLPTRCIGAAPGLQLEPAECALPLQVLVDRDNPFLHAEMTQSKLLAALPQLTPPLQTDQSESGERPALSDLFGCDFPHGPVQPVPNEDSALIALRGSSACTLSPLSSEQLPDFHLAVLCSEVARVDLSFLFSGDRPSPWGQILIQMVKEAGR